MPQATPPTPLTPLPDDAAIRQTASEILRGPDYLLTPGGPDQEAFIFRLMESLRRVVIAFGKWAESLYETAPVLYYLLVFGLLLLLGLLLLHIAYALRKAFTRADSATVASRINEAEADEPALWERRASEAQARGDRVYALRCLLMAGLVRLESGQKKRLRRGATNREILRRYKNSPAFEPLKLMVDLVDLKWYGGAPCEAADFDTGAQAYSRLRAAATLIQPAAESNERGGGIARA